MANVKFFNVNVMWHEYEATFPVQASSSAEAATKVLLFIGQMRDLEKEGITVGIEYPTDGDDIGIKVREIEPKNISRDNIF